MEQRIFAGTEKQFPQEHYPHHRPQSSNWAVFLLVCFIIGAGLFFILQTRNTQSVAPVQTNTSPQHTPTAIVETTRLEAAAASIMIPDYSELF